MQVFAVDTIGPLPESTAGNSYILVAGDYFTKWMEAYALPNQEAVTVARKLVDQVLPTRKTALGSREAVRVSSNARGVQSAGHQEVQDISILSTM